MTPQEQDDADRDAQIERGILFASIIASLGIAVFLLSLALLNPMFALPLTILTWVVGYLTWRRVSRGATLPWRGAHQAQTTLFHGDVAMPQHDVVQLTAAEEAAFASLRQQLTGRDLR